MRNVALAIVVVWILLNLGVLFVSWVLVRYEGWKARRASLRDVHERGRASGVGW